jgi:hypothetical protein
MESTQNPEERFFIDTQEIFSYISGLKKHVPSIKRCNFKRFEIAMSQFSSLTK